MATSEDLEKGSSVPEETELCICSPCDTDGKHATAEGYCVNCEEYLCRQCFDGHLIPSVTRKHKLLDREHIPTAIADGDSGFHSKICPQHSEEVISYHCPRHSFLGCHLCFFSHQKSCKDVLCIPEVCNNLTNKQEYKDFAKQLAGFTKKCMQTTAEFKDKIQAIENSHVKTIAEIQKFKKQLLNAVDKAETDLVDKANKIKEEDLRTAKELNDKCNAILKENQKMTTIVDQVQKSETDLYIAMVKTKGMLRTMEEDIMSVGNTNRTRRVIFRANSDLLKTLKKPWALGNLGNDGIIQSVDYKLDINIKSGIDTSTCRPACSVLSSNNLVINDAANNSVKLVDITSNKLASELKLSSIPFGICKISDHEVAVAAKNKVIFVKTYPSLRKEREFAITGSCYGVGYCDKKLVLSYVSPDKVKILDMQGNVLNSFVNDDQGHAIFNYPSNLAVNPDNKRIYVSNFFSPNVVCMKFDGTVVAKYTDSELQGPWQVITDTNGQVYVCGRGSNNIHQLTADCKKVKVLLTKADGLNNPESICYDEVCRKLYIGQQNSDNLKVYIVA